MANVGERLESEVSDQSLLRCVAELFDNALGADSTSANVSIFTERMRDGRAHIRLVDDGAGLGVESMLRVKSCLCLSNDPVLALAALSQHQEAGERRLLGIALHVKAVQCSKSELIIRSSTLESSSINILRIHLVHANEPEVTLQTRCRACLPDHPSALSARHRHTHHASHVRGSNMPEGSPRFTGTIVSVLLAGGGARTADYAVDFFESASCLWVAAPLRVVMRASTSPPRELLVQPLPVAAIREACRQDRPGTAEHAAPRLPAMRDYLAARAQESSSLERPLVASGSGCAVANASTIVHATVVVLAEQAAGSGYAPRGAALPASLLQSLVLLNNKMVVTPGGPCLPERSSNALGTSQRRRRQRPSVRTIRAPRAMAPPGWFVM